MIGQMNNDDTIFLLARELEWAEAFLQDFPDCTLGHLYFSLLECELTKAEKHHARLNWETGRPE
jgi:hypothetical protein